MNSCPICGKEMKTYSDMLDGHLLLESSEECLEGHYSYWYNTGNYVVTVGDKQFNWNYNNKPPIKEIDEEINKLKIPYFKGLKYCPVNDGYGIIGYNWDCQCGKTLQFVSGGEECECGFIIPDIDPDTWYDFEMSKPIEERDWNIS